MAMLIRLRNKSARAFILNVARADTGKDIRTAIKYRALARKFKRATDPYWQNIEDLEKEHENAVLEMTSGSPELTEATREFNKNLRDVTKAFGEDTAHDAHNDGILLENEEFNFLKSKLFDIKGIPSEGEGGEIWEEILDAFENAEEVRAVKAVKDGAPLS